MALAGLKVVEFAGLAPGPFVGLILADNGASVTRVDKPLNSSPVLKDLLAYSKKSLVIDPHVPSGRDILLKLISKADVLIDPFRPGVMERLGLGPETFLGKGELNEGLVYARIVGFPRTGSYKDMAGHDINYLALSGVLSMLPGTEEKPSFPLNILADFAGGGLMCVLGILLALIERGVSGKGQVVNADMVSGTRYLSSFPLLHRAFFSDSSPVFPSRRGTGLLDGGAPFYSVYTCKDGKQVSVGCLEPRFFREFLRLFLSALPEEFHGEEEWRPNVRDGGLQRRTNEWGKLKRYIERGFLTQDRNFWESVFRGTDACVVPVLSPEEAASRLHEEVPNSVSSNRVPAVHPVIQSQIQTTRFPNSPARTRDLHSFVVEPGKHTREILAQLGVSEKEVRKLEADGAFGGKEIIKKSKL